MIVLSFALPEESKGVVRHIAGATRSGPATLPVIVGTLAGRQVVVIHTGMGMDSAAGRVESLLDGHTPSLWIAAGFGGALSPDLKIGDIVAAGNFSDPGLLAAIADITVFPARTGSLVTVKEVIETAQAKKDLGRHTGAIVVDMETAAVHRLCTARGIPMLALRAVSDTACQDVPVPAAVWFDTQRQRPRPLALVLYLATHPGRIGPFARFVRGVKLAGASLATFLLAALPALPEK